MSRARARTIGPRIRVSPHDGASGNAALQIAWTSPALPFCSRRRPKHFQRPTSSHIPGSRSASSETSRSGRGEPPWPESESELPNCAPLNSVRLTKPLRQTKRLQIRVGAFVAGKMRTRVSLSQWYHCPDPFRIGRTSAMAPARPSRADAMVAPIAFEARRKGSASK